MRNWYIIEGDGRNAFLKLPKPNIPFMVYVFMIFLVGLRVLLS